MKDAIVVDTEKVRSQLDEVVRSTVEGVKKSIEGHFAAGRHRAAV